MYEELVKRLRYENMSVLQMCDLMDEAADAIEELSRDLDSMNDANIALYGALPKWIPVTERLPNPTFAREWYLVALESGCVTTLGFERETMQWHITGSPVAYWMPLPEPPKEDE